ncbi:hypothetical protein [Streptomyces millisiae]|uniref:Heavy metal-binding domain-containing protein n=1 Tax=Streptomyces millisiae TaxID=3075542 RepID=A0ABU2LPA7_9ACTN|nr:hypothetical protein [Streptomyces sp. DSM 44918]MDT0319047.1 hypothetical protein [Streptomyces sp. DSM 44918]
MRTITKVGAFGAGLTLTFGVAFGIGNAVGPVDTEPTTAHDDAPHGDTPEGATEEESEASEAAREDSAAEQPGGLQISERGYTLVPLAEPPRAGEPTDFRFRILGPDGEPLTAYETSHEKDLHLIVVRRDLSGFQHVHPELGADGTWSVPLTFESAGDHRIFADFTPAGDPGGSLTLGADLAVTGDYTPGELPEPTRTTTVDGYTVTLAGDLTAGADSELTLSVSRDGEPVTDLEPYLGAYGHLVALRAGDLAYLHVHPEGAPDDGTTRPGPEIAFSTTAPSAGDYRLYLDFKHEGEVHTAEFTATAGAGDGTSADHEDGGDGGHGGH